MFFFWMFHSDILNIIPIRIKTELFAFTIGATVASFLVSFTKT
jgi:hypothetical protein